MNVCIINGLSGILYLDNDFETLLFEKKKYI